MQREFCTTGINGLDEVLGGGFAACQQYLIEGDPGSGKTTLAMQYLIEGVRKNDRCLYITLSETKEELQAVARAHGWSLNGVEIAELMPSERELLGDAQLTMLQPAEVELGETMEGMLGLVERTKPARVVFDSLSELRLLAQTPLRYRRQVLALKAFLSQRCCTALLLDDRVLQSDDKQLQSVIHGVIYLEQLAPSYGAERRRMRVIKYRGQRFRGGYHDFVIRTGGIVVFPRLVAADHDEKHEMPVISSGNRALDTLLGGGIDRGTSTLLLGPAGSGKSTVAMQYALAAAQRREHAAFFAFDESLETLHKRLRSMGFQYKEGSGPGEVGFRTVDPAELTPGEFAHLVRESADRDHASVIVIDSLNGYINAMPEERFLTAHLHELLMFLGKRGVATMMVVAQHGLMGSQTIAPVDTSYLADSVILFRYFEHQGRVKKAMSVVKKRSGAHEETIREIAFGSNGIKVSEPLTKFRGILTGVPSMLQETDSSSGSDARNLR